ncbi:MAG: RHS repeat-associated core domain-containing protein, partial [Candidatus Acidiferrales bacterium]
HDTSRSYFYGLERISQYRQFSGGTQTSYYVYDGHGSVRALTDQTGNVTDTYDYDAFGNLTHSTGATPNEFLFAGEQFDSTLNLYYNRARYLNTTTGRFWSMDTFEGDPRSPLSLHKYLYTEDDSINILDPSGHQDEIEEAAAESIASTLNGIDTQVGLSAQSSVERSLGLVIETPQGQAIQEETTEALDAKAAVQNGAPIYRLGTMGQSGAAEAQYWALENPLTTPGYPPKYGIPEANVANADFLEVGVIKPDSRFNFITRVAPDGEAVEVVAEPGSVELQGFFTFDELGELTEDFLRFF